MVKFSERFPVFYVQKLGLFQILKHYFMKFLPFHISHHRQEGIVWLRFQCGKLT